MYYIDTSAAVKLLVEEEGSPELAAWVAEHGEQAFSSDLLRTELLRVTRRVAPHLMVQARAILDALVIVTTSTEVCERAAMLEPRVRRSLDALHLATALEVGDELQALITYDRNMSRGAENLGIKVLKP